MEFAARVAQECHDFVERHERERASEERANAAARQKSALS